MARPGRQTDNRRSECAVEKVVQKVKAYDVIRFMKRRCNPEFVQTLDYIVRNRAVAKLHSSVIRLVPKSHSLVIARSEATKQSTVCASLGLLRRAKALLAMTGETISVQL